MMTLTEFAAAKRWSDNLASEITDAQDARWDDDPSPAPGWVYPGLLYIEKVQPHWPSDARARGSWFLLLERDEFISDDLPVLEQRLYDWAVSAGFFS
jgi:hypothetical protein